MPRISARAMKEAAIRHSTSPASHRPAKVSTYGASWPADSRSFRANVPSSLAITSGGA